MAKYRVWSGGDGTGGADNTNWAQAYATLEAALAVPPSAGDYILVHYTSQESNTADKAASVPAGVLIITVNKDASEACTAMGTNGWVGTTGAYIYHLDCGVNVSVNGLTIRNGGTGNDSIGIRRIDGGAVYADSCYFWLGSTHTGSRINIGQSTLDAQNYGQFINCTFRFGNSLQLIAGNGKIRLIGGGISSDGSSPSVLAEMSSADPGGSTLEWIGGDLSLASTLVGDTTSTPATYIFAQCKINSSVVALATQSFASLAHAEVWVIDCSDNAGTPVRGIWGYHNALGSVVKDTGIYFTSGAGWSWKVVGTSNSSIRAPFNTPWIDFYNSTNTSITPYIEVLRDGSTTAYTDAQVWAEWVAKTTSGSDLAAFAGRDRQALDAIVAGTAASNQAAGAGLGSWTGEAGSAWSGKCDSGAAFTAAEDGYLRGRIAVVGAITVYVDPQIRT